MSEKQGAPSAKEMVEHLMDTVKMSAAQVSEALGKRVSRRTVYRWAKGESTPQQSSDLEELERLYQSKGAK